MLLDDLDKDLLDYVWRADKKGYLHRNTSRTVNGVKTFVHCSMARIIATRMVGRTLTSKEIVDHINHCVQDNRRANLRMTTVRGNAQNLVKSRGKSKYIGVSFDKNGGTWRAQCGPSGRNRNLGSFQSQESAAQAYNFAAEKMGYLTTNNL